MTMMHLPPGPPSPRFAPAQPLVAPSALHAGVDLAGYPIAAYGHVRIFHRARCEDGAVTGLATSGPEAHWADAFVDAVLPPVEAGCGYYRLTPHTEVAAGVMRAIPLAERDRLLVIPANGSQPPGNRLQVGVFRLVRPFASWTLPDQAEECLTERIAQGLYALPRSADDREPVATEIQTARFLESLRDDLETAYETVVRSPAQREALWAHALRRAGPDRGAIATLYGEVAAILALDSPASSRSPVAPGLELSAPGTIF